MNTIYAWLSTDFLQADPLVLLLVRVTVLLTIAWLTHSAVAPLNPRWCVLLWRLTALAIAMIPVATYLLPAVALPILPPEPPPVIASVIRLPQMERKARLLTSSIAKPTAITNEHPTSETGSEMQFSSQAKDFDSPAAMPPHPANLASTVSIPESVEFNQTFTWHRRLLTIWLVGCCVNLVAEILAWMMLRRLVQSSTIASQEITQLAQTIAKRLGYNGIFEIRRTSELASPCVVGLLRPTILLPDADCEASQSANLPSILSHEIAHLAGYDLFWNDTLRILSRVLWFHPLMWQVRSAHSTACDAVCDATAASSVGDVAGYGRLLAQMALRMARDNPRIALQMARPSSIRSRIEALQRRLYSTPLSRWSVSGAVVTGCVIAAMCASLTLAHAQPVAKVDLYGDPLPPGATLRLGTVRYRHSGYNACLAVLPDSSTIVTHPEEHRLRFWDALTGATIREFDLKDFNFDRIAVSPDGKLIAVPGFESTPNSSQKQIRILKTDTGEVVHTFKRTGHEGVSSLVFTSDSKLLISINDNSGKLSIEEISSGTELLTQTFPADNSARMDISPNNKIIAISTGANTQRCFLWNWQSGDEPRELKTLNSRDHIGEINFSPNGQYFVSVGWGRHPVCIWDASKGEIIKRLEMPNTDDIFNGAVTFSPNGKQIFVPTRDRTGRRGHVLVWDVPSWKFDRTIDIKADRIAISGDSRFLIGADYGSTSSVYDLEQNVTLGKSESHGGMINTIEASQPDFIATASDDCTIRIWDSKTGRQKQILQHDAWVRAIAISPDGKHLVSSSLDDTVRLWEMPSGKEIYRLPGHGNLGGQRAVAFHEDSTQFSSFGDDFYLRVFDIRNGKALQESRIRLPDLKSADGSEDGDLQRCPFWNRARQVLSRDGKLLALGWASKIHLFDGVTGKPFKMLDTEAVQIEWFEFSPDGKQIVVCGAGEPIRNVLEDGAVRVNTGNNPQAAIWDIESGKQTTKFELKPGYVGCGCFSPDGQRLAITSLDTSTSTNTIYRLDGQVDTVLNNMPSRVWKMSFTHDGRGLMTVHGDASVLVWNLSELRNQQAK